MKNILVISSYPEKRAIHGKSTVGVASYAKNTLLSLKKTGEKLNITVLAEKIPGEEEYSHDKIRVKRVWKRDSLVIFPSILKEIITNHKNAETIVIEFEMAMFGNILSLLPLPAFLLILKLMRKKIVFVCHQVLPNIADIAPHINISEQSFSALFMNIFMQLFYRYILLISDRVIVFEEVLKQKLTHFGSARKISVIPHGVETFKNVPTKIAARKRLKIKKDAFVVTAFGYLAWYKGSDWIVHALSDINRKNSHHPTMLILAGGPNPNRTDKDYYTRYLKRLQKEAEENNILITGFVPQKEIAYYYQASDVIVLPYRTFMSSSGPLSIAFSFKKPFLLSNALKGVLEQKDTKEILKNYRLSQKRIIFNDTKDLVKKLRELQKDKNLRKKLAAVSNELRIKRGWDMIGRKYHEELAR